MTQLHQLLAARVKAWRDSGYPSDAYPALADAPERKDELVDGSYELPAPDGLTTVAVKVTDMLGEEVLSTAVVQNARRDPIYRFGKKGEL